MSAKHRVSQIILLFGYRYRLHQVDVSTPHVVINYLTRSLFFILLKFPPNWKLIKVKEIKDRIFIKNLDHKMTMGLMEAKRIVDELTIEYDMNNIYRIRLVE